MAETDRDAMLTRIDSLAPALIRRAAPVRFALATTPAKREAVFRLRAATVVERGWAPAAAFPDGLERDRHDDSAMLIAGWDGDTIAAAARLVFPTEGIRLPTEEAFDLVAEPAGRIVNLDRMVVARAWSDPGHRVFIGLAARCWLELRGHGYHLWIGTDTPAMLRLYRRIGWTVTVLGPSRQYWGVERLPCRFDPLDGFATPLSPTSEPTSATT
jgi:N-acyl-L-homoserine lactone synthetase